MSLYYCFACKKVFESESNVCHRCGKGAARASRKLLRSTPRVDIYHVYVDKKLVGNQRVIK
jgi:predicted amidophosphoribosyltransferase